MPTDQSNISLLPSHIPNPPLMPAHAVAAPEDDDALTKRIGAIPDKRQRMVQGIAAGLVPMISGDQKQLVPRSKVDAQTQSGWRQAVLMTDPDENMHLVGHDEFSSAVKDGWVAGQSFKGNDLKQRIIGAAQEPSLGEKAWNFATTPIVPTETIMKHMDAEPSVGGAVKRGILGPLGAFNWNVEPNNAWDALEKQKELKASDSPGVSAAKNFGANTAEGMADVLNSMYGTPLGLATLGAGPLAKTVGGKVLGPVLKGLGRAANIGFAGKGAADVAASGLAEHPLDPLRAIGYSTGVTKTPPTMTPDELQAGISGAGMVTQGIAHAPGTLKDVADTGIAVGQKAKSVGQAVKAIAIPGTGTAEQAATQAWRPRNSRHQWQKQVSSALPDMKREALQRGVDVDHVTIQQAHELAGQAKRSVWSEYEDLLGPNAKATADTSPVAKTIRSTISTRMSEQNPSLVKRIGEVADTYEKRAIPLGELEARIQELNNETRAIEARHPADKAAAQAAPENAFVFAERNALRNILDSKIQELEGTSAQPLKDRYGALTSIQDVIQRRIPVIERQAPDSLHGILTKAAAGGRIIGGVLTGNPVAVAEGAGAIALQKRSALKNDPNYLTRQAFKKAQTRPAWAPKERPSPPPPPPKVNPLGLPSGQYEVQPVPEAPARGTMFPPTKRQLALQAPTEIIPPENPMPMNRQLPWGKRQTGPAFQLPAATLEAENPPANIRNRVEPTTAGPTADMDVQRRFNDSRRVTGSLPRTTAEASVGQETAQRSTPEPAAAAAKVVPRGTMKVNRHLADLVKRTRKWTDVHPDELRARQMDALEAAREALPGGEEAPGYREGGAPSGEVDPSKGDVLRTNMDPMSYLERSGSENPRRVLKTQKDVDSVNFWRSRIRQLKAEGKKMKPVEIGSDNYGAVEADGRHRALAAALEGVPVDVIYRSRKLKGVRGNTP